MLRMLRLLLTIPIETAIIIRIGRRRSCLRAQLVESSRQSGEKGDHLWIAHHRQFFRVQHGRQQVGLLLLLRMIMRRIRRCHRRRTVMRTLRTVLLTIIVVVRLLRMHDGLIVVVIVVCTNHQHCVQIECANLQRLADNVVLERWRRRRGGRRTVERRMGRCALRGRRQRRVDALRAAVQRASAAAAGQLAAGCAAAFARTGPRRARRKRCWGAGQRVRRLRRRGGGGAYNDGSSGSGIGMW